MSAAVTCECGDAFHERIPCTMLTLLSAIAMAAPTPFTVEWTELLPESKDTVVNTMPIGNGRIGANAFVDNSTGTPQLGLLLASQEAWSEAGELIKIGWVAVGLSPPPAGLGAHFVQRLDVATATLVVELGAGVTISVFAHAHVDTFSIDVTSPSPVGLAVKATLIRSVADSVTPAFDCRAYNVSADSVMQPSALPTLQPSPFANVWGVSSSNEPRR